MNYFPKTNLEWLKASTILLTRSGSHAYGTNLPTSDVDVKGVCIPPEPYFLGFASKFEQAEFKEPADGTIYDIRKFFNLAADCNPNIIEVLFVAEEDVLAATPLGAKLRANAKLFLSKKARHTFSGYAIAQLKRIRTHRRWLLSPPKEEPTRKTFGLPETTVIAADERGAAEALLDPAKELDEAGWAAAARKAGFSAGMIETLQREKGYNQSRKEWAQYQNWLATRNKTRAAIEAEHGYDCKHAMHLVRLLRMCKEILTDGSVLVKRPDAEELLAIRNGAWSYDELVGWAEAQDAAMAPLYDASPLPHAPDRHKLDALCCDMVGEALYNHEGTCD